MKLYSCGSGCSYYRAPIYLTATIAGMFAMIFAKQLAYRLGVAKHPDFEAALHSPIHPQLKAQLLQQQGSAGGSSINSNSSALETPAQKASKWVQGMVVAISSGTFGALQYAVVQIGKRHEQQKSGCWHANTTCPAELTEQFNTFVSISQALPHCIPSPTVTGRAAGLVDGFFRLGCDCNGWLCALSHFRPTNHRSYLRSLPHRRCEPAVFMHRHMSADGGVMKL
jgi:hypothetical protein